MENSPKLSHGRLQSKVSLRILQPISNQTKNIKSTPIASSENFFDELGYQKNIIISVNQLNLKPESDNFNTYYQFINNILKSSHFLNSIFKELKFEQPLARNKIMKLSAKSFSIDRSMNGQQITSLQDFNNFIYKKQISIEVIKSGLSLDSFGSIQSENQIVFESDYVLTKDILSHLFETPSPFIMIESLCLLLKYLWKTNTTLNKRNCLKLLLVAIMLSFKLCYDQQVQGINWYYSSITNVDSKQIKKLQSKFLRQLQFETDVTKQQYFIVSTYLLGEK